MQSSLVVCFLSVATLLLAILHPAAPLEEEDGGRGPLGNGDSPYSTLANLLRKRALESALRGPPLSPALTMLYPETLEKRSGGDGDEMWIWMPAHGYIPVPKNEQGSDQVSGYRVANLMRHGRRRRR